MSRRSRRKRGPGGVGWAGRVMIGLVLVGLVLAGILFVSVRTFLHSESFRGLLAAEVRKAAGVDGRFSPFRWQGLAVDSDLFDATGGGPLRALRVEGLHTEVGVGGIRRGVWELKGSNLRRVEAELDFLTRETRPGVAAIAPPAAPPATHSKSGWLPSEVELKALDIQSIAARAATDHGPIHLSGVRLLAEPSGGRRAYRVETLGGKARLPFSWIDEVRLERASGRWQDGRIFLNNATAGIWETGRIEAGGEWDLASRQFAFEGGISDAKCSDLLADDWLKHVRGDLASDFTVHNRSGEPEAFGRLTVRNGTLTALPVLDALAAYADTRRFRILNLSEAQSDWRWKNGEWFLNNLVLAAEGLIRLEGGMVIRGREIDGNFRLGLTPGTLATIPGAETHVFVPGERGLLWTPLRITGTPDNPKEDLSDRLVAAAGRRMFDILPETGERVLKFSQTVIADPKGVATETGARVIESGVNIARDVGAGVVDGILGNLPFGQPPPPRAPPSPPRDEEKTDP